MVYVRTKGSFSRTQQFLNKLANEEYLNMLDRYAQMGLEALKAATPVDTGKTASMWHYDITTEKHKVSINYYNDNSVINKTGYEFNIVVLLTTGHATRTGGWVEGRDFVNPTIKPIFDQIANDAWREINNM